MTDQNGKPPPEEKKKLTAERYEDLIDALESLYIKCNLSGRLNFMRDWPDVATYLFDPDLIRFDSDGCDDRDVRAILEDEAEEKRFHFLQTISDVEEKSALDGVLQKDYIQGLIDRLGWEIITLIYAQDVLDKFNPPSDPAPDSSDEDTPQAATESQAPPPDAQ